MAARQLIGPPTFTSLPHGLWDTIQHPAPPDHWRQGVTWIERCPTGDTTYDECLAVTGTGAPPEPPAKTSNVEQTYRGATPFTVYAEFECSPVGSLTDAGSVATDALARVEQQQVEAAFWTGTAGGQGIVFPHLAADTEALDSQGIVLQPVASPAVTGVDVAHALGELEADLADCYAGQGLIHVPRSALPTLAAWKLARLDDDGRLVTPAGNLIVAGGGYTGSGPDGSAPAAGTAWIYATGAAFGYRSDVFFTEVRDSLDRSENTIRMIAERTYLLGFECCLLAAHIVLGVPTE